MFGPGRDGDRGRSGRREAPRRRDAPCTCEWPGCTEQGDYPAPRARNQLREYRWLCLGHVREYNARWDYFAGMGPQEIEEHLRADVTWHRPTWRFGTAPGRDGPHIHDPFGFFGEDGPQPGRGPGRYATTGQRMMAVLGLEAGFTLAELKARFKVLAKANHPDLHGGDKAAEERLKSIIEAYRYLKETRAFA